MLKMIMKIIFILFLFILSWFSYQEKFGDFKDLYFSNVVSDSMTPVIKKGAIVVSRPYNRYKINDVVTFQNPNILQTRITHRIVDIGSDNGEYFVTKGDNNNTVDPWQVKKEIILGKIFITIPYIGYLVQFTRAPFGLFLTIVLPLGALVILESEVVFKEVSKFVYKYEDVVKNSKLYLKFRIFARKLEERRNRV